MRKDSEPIEALGGRTWEELEVLEHDDGALMFKDQIRTKGAKGWKVVEVRVRVLRPMELLRARADAKALAGELDIARDDLYFDEIEELCQLAYAIRTAEAPHPQFADAKELATRYDESSLKDVAGRLAHYKGLLDPRDEVKTEEEAWELVQRCYRARNLGPLVDTPGHVQRSLLLFMVDQAFHSHRAPWAAPSSETSTPAGSPPTSSAPSSAAPG